MATINVMNKPLTVQSLAQYRLMPSFFRPGLRTKVTSLILSLITLVLFSVGIFLINRQSSQLKEDLRQTGLREMKSLKFTSSRGILDQDDLGIADNLQNLSTINGFVYARVLSSTGRLISDKEMLKLPSVVLAKLPGQLNTENLSSEIKIEQIEENSVTYTIFSSAILHPFIAKDPPALGSVALIFSDEFASSLFTKNLINLSIAGLIFWVLGTAGSLALSWLVVKPITKLSEGAKIVGAGDLHYRLPDLGTDEIGELARQFNVMTASLEEARKQRENQVILDEQIRQAKEIQEGMNPSRFLKKPGYSIKGFTRAAKGVGGDYFDYQYLPDGRLALLITDVSGKSISASLVMVLIKTVVSTYIKLFSTIRGDQIVSTINRVMCAQTHIDKFATIMFCIYDPETRYLEFTNGGHGPLLLYRADHQELTISKIEGLPLGIDEDNEYSIAQTRLNPGDMVLLLTDGITEAWDVDRNEFGLARLRERILAYNRLNPKEIVEKLITDIDQYTTGAEQHDDMTLLILKIPPE